MKRLLLLILMIVVSFAMISCNRNDDDISEKASYLYAQQLIEVKNPYIGDNSADIKILELLNITQDFGSYQIELQTDKEPYIIKLNFKNKPEKSDDFDEKMYDKAFVILALIENANEVQWSYPSYEKGEDVLITMHVNEKDAKNILNKDIKEFGKSRESLQQLLDKLSISNKNKNVNQVAPIIS